MLSTVVLAVTTYWLATRSARIAAIDHELNLGYATDRFGEPSVPGKPDSGDVWRAEQVASDNKVTFWLLAAALPALFWVCLAVRRARRRGNASLSPEVSVSDKE